MPHDPVPGLLSRATELLEAEFAALPAFDPAGARPGGDGAGSGGCGAPAGRQLPLLSILSMPGRCSSRRIRWRGPPMRWP
jgi:hypothetical protein